MIVQNLAQERNKVNKTEDDLISNLILDPYIGNYADLITMMSQSVQNMKMAITEAKSLVKRFYLKVRIEKSELAAFREINLQK